MRHSTDILWLIVPTSSTTSPIPVIALLLTIRLPVVAVAAKHALLSGLRAEFTFTSAAVLRRLPSLLIRMLLIIVEVIVCVELLLM